MLRLGSVLALMVISMLGVLAGPLDDFRGSPAINSPKTAVLVIDLKTGKELLSHNADIPLIPASIMKSVTTATLLKKVGEDFRYHTHVKHTGHIKDGILEGDIIIEASADPSVGTRHSPGSDDMPSQIADELQKRGVKEVRGRIIIDESHFPGPTINPTWQSGDLPHAYGTGTHGFNFEDNASGNKSVANPSSVFERRLVAAMQRAGITLTRVTNTDTHRHRLTEHVSAPLDEILRSCMMRSDNQFAEAFLRTTGLKYGNVGSTERGASETLRFWKSKDARMEGVVIKDGSGLSRSNRVTANFMADVLAYMSDNPWYASLFPLAGQEGTLKKFLSGTPLEGWIALKTGSMSGIQCYAGYKLDENYAPTHAVVVIMNGMANRAAARKEVEKLLLSTFPQK